jgi:hypothetical protein
MSPSDTTLIRMPRRQGLLSSSFSVAISTSIRRRIISSLPLRKSCIVDWRLEEERYQRARLKS